MLTISSHSMEWVKDPFGILSGKRYEFIINIEVDEEDELYSPHGLYLRVIYCVEDSGSKIVKYEIIERGTDRYLDFALDPEEMAAIDTYCQEQLV